MSVLARTPLSSSSFSRLVSCTGPCPDSSQTDLEAAAAAAGQPQRAERRAPACDCLAYPRKQTEMIQRPFRNVLVEGSRFHRGALMPSATSEPRDRASEPHLFASATCVFAVD